MSREGWVVTPSGTSFYHLDSRLRFESLTIAVNFLETYHSVPVKPLRIIKDGEDHRFSSTQILLVRRQAGSLARKTYEYAFDSQDPATCRWLSKTKLPAQRADSLRQMERRLRAKLEFHKSRPPGLENW